MSCSLALGGGSADCLVDLFHLPLHEKFSTFPRREDGRSKMILRSTLGFRLAKLRGKAGWGAWEANFQESAEDHRSEWGTLYYGRTGAWEWLLESYKKEVMWQVHITVWYCWNYRDNNSMVTDATEFLKWCQLGPVFQQSRIELKWQKAFYSAFCHRTWHDYFWGRVIFMARLLFCMFLLSLIFLPP